MAKKHNSKALKQSIPQCYEPLWNIWHTGRMLWQGDCCILYELLAEDKEAECLLLLPVHTAFLEQIKIFSCQQDLGFSPLKAYTIFEDCICLRLSSITPVSLASEKITTKSLNYFYFIKDTLSLLFKLAEQEIWLSGFTIEDTAFLPDGTPILFRFHKSVLSESKECPLQSLCKFLTDFCKKSYPSCLFYLEQLINQCGISDIYSDKHMKLPPNAILEFYAILIKGVEALLEDYGSELAITPGIIETPPPSSPKTYDLCFPATEFQKDKRYGRHRRIYALASLLLLITCLCIVFIFYSTNGQTYTSSNAQTTFHAVLSPAATASPGTTPDTLSTAPGLSESASTPEPIQYLDLHGKTLHILPPPDSVSPVWTLDCSGNALTTLSGLSEYKNIRELYANNNQITQLDAVCTQKNIQVLLLQNNRLTDILPVQDLSSLEHLDVSGNQSLQDITALFHMTSLQFVNLMNTNVSEKDIKKLQQALPNCKILPETS